MADIDFQIVPYNKEARKSLPTLRLLRRAGQPELRATLSVAGMIGDCHYVEIYTNKAKNMIKLVPVKVPTAFARSVSCDLIAAVHIAGASALIDTLEYKLGKYVLVDNLTFKYAGIFTPTNNSKGKDV